MHSRGPFSLGTRDQQHESGAPQPGGLSPSSDKDGPSPPCWQAELPHQPPACVASVQGATA